MFDASSQWQANIGKKVIKFICYFFRVRKCFITSTTFPLNVFLLLRKTEFSIFHVFFILWFSFCRRLLKWFCLANLRDMFNLFRYVLYFKILVSVGLFKDFLCNLFFLLMHLSNALVIKGDFGVFYFYIL